MTRRPILSLALALAAVTLLAYAPVFQNDFVNYDDPLYITNSPEVRGGLSPEGVAWAFSSFHGANWFPVTRLSWMLDASLFGLSPVGFHATSLALHAAAALLLFLALARMTRAPWPSAFVAAVFALHPLHVESVAWASARKDVLSGLCFMGALVAHERAVRPGSTRAPRVAVAVFAAIGLMAKPTLVTLPFLLLLLDAWPLARFGGPGKLDATALRRAVLEKLPLFVLAAISSALTVAAQSSWAAVQSAQTLPFDARLKNALMSCAAYLGKTLWPTGLSVFYPHPGEELGWSQPAACAALLLLLSALALASWRRRPYLTVGWLWYLGALVPVIGLVQVGSQAMADRYTYLPLIGLSLAVAWGVRDLAARWPGARVATAVVGCAVCGAMAAATWLQVQRWSDSQALFEHAIEVTDDNYVAHVNLGKHLANRGELDRASAHVATALRLVPHAPDPNGVMGELRLQQGRPHDAIAHFRIAVTAPVGAHRWHAGLGRALLAAGRAQEAAASLRGALAEAPESGAYHADLARALAARGDHPGAIASYREALRLAPEQPVLHGELAELLAEAGDLAAARAELEESLRLAPGRPELHGALARVEALAGRGAAAAEQLEAALAAGAESPELLNNLAWLLVSSPLPELRAPGRAVELATRAAEASERREPVILDTLAAAYAGAGRPDEAVATAREALAGAEAERRGELAEAIRTRLADYESRR